MSDFTSLIVTSQDTIDWLNQIADGIDRIMLSVAERLAIPSGYAHPKESALLQQASEAIQPSMSNGLMMQCPVLEFDPPLYRRFRETLCQLAVVWAHAMNCQDPPPAG